MSNLPLSLKTPSAAGVNATAGNTNATSAAGATAAAVGARVNPPPPAGTAAVSQNIAAIVSLPDNARPEVLSRSGNDAILRVGSSVMSVSGLKQDLHTVQRHIGFERERRLDAEKLIATESESLLDKEQAEAVARREEELAKLHEERTAMVEFLKRGTDEAKRISADVNVLRARAHEKEVAEADLQQEREHLETILQQLNRELVEHEGQMKLLAKKKDEMESRQAELNAMASSTEQQTIDQDKNLAAMKAELELRLVTARRVEAMEGAMGVISASSRRMLHELEHINSNIVKISDERIAAAVSSDGKGASADAANLAAELDRATEAPEFDSEVEAEETRITSVVGATARTKFARCSSIVKAMLTALTRYDLEIAARLVKNRKQHEEAIAAAHKYLRDTRQKCNEETEQWERRYRQREEQLRRANEFRNKAVSASLKEHQEALADGTSGDSGRAVAAEKALLESSFSLTNYFERIMNETAQERNLTLSENAKLKQKAEHYSRDYSMVKDLRQQYREMETQKISLESTLRAAEEENRHLKTIMTGEGAAGGSADHHAGPGAGDVFGLATDGFNPALGAAARRPTSAKRVTGRPKQPWRGNTFS